METPIINFWPFISENIKIDKYILNGFNDLTIKRIK